MFPIKRKIEIIENMVQEYKQLMIEFQEQIDESEQILIQLKIEEQEEINKQTIKPNQK